MNTRTRGPLTIVLLAVSMWAIFGRATRAQDSSSVGSSGAQDGPQLRVSTKASVYRQGELIPLELSFTSKISDRYQVNMAGYDRSGRMGYEKFLVEPTGGTKDPILVYFESGTLFMSGGLTNFRFLSDSPYVIHLDLNEWVRIDKLGRSSMKSQRVSC